MNVIAAYGNAIRKVDISIKNLQERKLKLPLIANIIDKSINGLLVKRKTLVDEMNIEVGVTDAYIENILKSHNSIKN